MTSQPHCLDPPFSPLLQSIQLTLLAEHSKSETFQKENYEALTMSLEREKDRCEALLYRCLPKAIARKLRSGQGVEARAHQQLTVMFTK